MRHGWRGPARITAFSITMTLQPTWIAPPASPMMRAPCRTRTPAAISTSPQIVATGAIQAAGAQLVDPGSPVHADVASRRGRRRSLDRAPDILALSPKGTPHLPSNPLGRWMRCYGVVNEL